MHERQYMKITLDHNCIIALEMNEPDAQYIRDLIDMHNRNKIQVRVAAIGASEMLPGKKYPSHFSDYDNRIAALGLKQVEKLSPVGKWDMTYWDQSVYGDQRTEALERRIHDILFPDIEFDYQAFCKIHSLSPLASDQLNETWRNAKCDVLGLWSHINYGGDIFITSDRNFHKQSKKPRLIALGAKNIMTPQEAATVIATK